MSKLYLVTYLSSLYIIFFNSLIIVVFFSFFFSFLLSQKEILHPRNDSYDGSTGFILRDKKDSLTEVSICVFMRDQAHIYIYMYILLNTQNHIIINSAIVFIFYLKENSRPKKKRSFIQHHHQKHMITILFI